MPSRSCQVFTDKLFGGLSLEDATEQLLEDMGKMQIGDQVANLCRLADFFIVGNCRFRFQLREGPSVFECQLKIFDGWFRNWTEQDKMEFVNQICMRNDL